PVVPDNSDSSFLLPTKTQFAGGEQAVGNQDIPVDAIVDELRLAVLADDEQRWHFALPDPRREFDIDLAAVVIRVNWPPGRTVALDRVAIPPLIDFRDDRCRRKGLCTSAPVFRVEPGDRRHVRLFARAEFDQVGPSIGVDNQVGLDGGPRRLHHDMHAPGFAVSAFGVTDYPTHGVARGQWP